MSQRVKGLVLAVAAVTAVLIGPHAAEASLYIWNVDANGSWTTASNWLYAGGGPNNGFPNGRSDQAFFTGTYTAPRSISVPFTITVGTIYFGADFAITLAGPGRLHVDNGSAAAQIVTTTSQPNHVTLLIDLASPLVTNVTAGSAVWLGAVEEVGGVRTLTKRGPGSLYLTRTTGYTGVTRVEAGSLTAAAAGGTIRGHLEVGTGAAASPALATLSGGQLQITRTVDVLAGGRLAITGAEVLRRLRVDGGQVTVQNTGVAFQELVMAGGLLETSHPLELPDAVTVTSNAQGAAALRSAPGAPATAGLDLGQRTPTFIVNDGPADVDLEISTRVFGGAGLIKDGAGTLRFTGGLSNTNLGATIVQGGVMELARTDNTLTIAGPLRIGYGTLPARARLLRHNSIADDAPVIVGPLGTLEGAGYVEEIRYLGLTGGGAVSLAATTQLTTTDLAPNSGRITLVDPLSHLAVRGEIRSLPESGDIPAIEGAGVLVLGNGERPLVVGDGPPPIDLRIAVEIQGVASAPIKRGSGALQLERGSQFGLTVEEGAVLVTGTFAPAVKLIAGRLGGTGTVGAIDASGGRIAPGLSPGRLTTGTVTLSGALEVELNGTRPAADYDQLEVRGRLVLGDATLAILPGFTAPANTSFTIVANDGTDPVTGTFANLPEGATLTAAGQRFTLSYVGGDGNDVVLTATTQVTYYLAEGATGSFFDDDVLIANPNDRQAPVTLTFLKGGGDTIVSRRVVPAMGRLTVAVEEIPGLEATAASVQVVSDDRLPLIVERSMFWDASYYGGHTANAVAQPETRWVFAEGFQGFFDTYILIANAEPTPTTATLTFLREGAGPVVFTVPIAAFARKTIYAGDYPELKDRAFGIIVEATQPVIAERAMYFASQPGRLWAGGHVNTGIVTPSTSWFHAEGATGSYFNTFILLSNPQNTAAQVELRFLLSTGEVITRRKTLAAGQRLTVNPWAEGDARLQNAALSTVVQADVPIVSERSMYWPGDGSPFGEGHNSSGVASLATRWGLAEGRLGGPHGFDTFILLANPSTTPAEITITYLRDTGAPIVRTYTVPATARFNVDVKTSVPDLRESTFGARIEVTNAVPIAVERSLYWNANGVFWAGGSNALGTPLP